MTEPEQLYTQQAFKWLRTQLLTFWGWLIRPWWHRVFSILIMLALIFVGMMYGIAQWYIHTEQSKPLVEGVTFIPEYAQFLGLNPQQTMDALINDVGARNFRLTSYWKTIEPQPGKFDFTELDWQMKKAEASHSKVLLVVGLRQPRWPECQPPSWVDTSKPTNQWEPEVLQYISAVVNRYKDSPALGSWQLENEYFLQGFGNCQNFSRQRLIDEYNLLKKLDPTHSIIVGRSNNDLGVPLGQPTPDEFSVSVYKRVWDARVTHRYLEYPFPAWYYAWQAGWQKIVTGKDMIIGEMQAEPWLPHGKTVLETSLAEQNKTLNAARLQQHFNFAKGTGMRTIYYWGAEYWYYRWQIEGDKSVWNTAKAEFLQSSTR